MSNQVDPKLALRFQDLVAKSIDEQCEFFLKSFIFALGDDWPEVVKLSTTFKKYLADSNREGSQNELDEGKCLVSNNIFNTFEYIKLFVMNAK